MKKYLAPEITISEFVSSDAVLFSFTEKDKWDDGGYGETPSQFN